MNERLLEQLPENAMRIWNDTYIKANEKYGSDKAEKIAWANVKSNFQKVEEVYVGKFKKQTQFKTVRYVMKVNEAHITKSENGSSYLEYIISGNELDGNNQKWSDFALKRFAEQINEESLTGYIANEHDALHLAKSKGLTPDELEAYMKQMNSGIKAISARYDQGKLYSTIQMPTEMVEKVKDLGVSIEARVPVEAIMGNELKQGRLTGFIFTNDPAYTNSRLVSA